jgi:hypothetical protein
VSYNTGFYYYKGCYHEDDLKMKENDIILCDFNVEKKKFSVIN